MSIEVRSPLNASVWQIEVVVGQQVAQYDALVILESMKTEIPVEAPSAGTISEIRARPGALVAEGEVLVVIGS